MIQRVQSLWLLLAAAATLLTVRFSFYSGNIVIANQPKKFEYLTALSNTPLMLLTFLLGIGCLIIIFLYKNRKLQMKLIIPAILISVLNIFLFFNQSKKFVAGEGNYDLGSILVLIVPIFLLLAARGVYKDDKLIKSLDRLR
jgi:dipeptide/tripeptide permease